MTGDKPKSLINSLRQDGAEADFEFNPPKMGDVLDATKIIIMLGDDPHIAIIRKDADTDYGVEFPDVPGCISAGRTLDEAKTMAAEALAGHLAVLNEMENQPQLFDRDALYAERCGSNIEFAFFDFESSGLGPESFPTEIGWALLTAPGTVETGSVLIRPEPAWLSVPGSWSMESQSVTGITRAMLESDGLPAAVALERFRCAVGDRLLVSDAPEFDGHWLHQLARAAMVDWPLLRPIVEYYSVMGQVADGVEILSAENYARQHWPNRHRAADDAGRLAWAFMIAR